MQIQVFSIPAFGNEEALQQMNAFMRSHQVIDVEKHLVQDNGQVFWTFCIRYQESNGQQASPSKSKSKIDYKEVLDEATFKIFAGLRECRKKMAEKHGVPVYAIFTNEELAQIARLPELTVENMQQVNGIGKKKMEKYGVELLQCYQESNQTNA